MTCVHSVTVTLPFGQNPEMKVFIFCHRGGTIGKYDGVGEVAKAKYSLEPRASHTR